MAIKLMTEPFVMAENSAVVLHPATTDEKRIRGLQGLGLALGFTMDSKTVSEMGRRISLNVPAGGTFDTSTVNYNFLPGDKAWEEFRNAAINRTKILAIRLYMKYGYDFSAPDVISDPTTGLYVGSVSDPKTDTPNGIFSGSLDYMPGGAFCLFVAHKVGTDLSYVQSTRTIASSSGDFITKGFEVGDTLLFDYADGNAPLYLKAESVAAGAIVVEAGVGDEALLTGDFAGIATTSLHGATPQPIDDFT